MIYVNEIYTEVNNFITKFLDGTRYTLVKACKASKKIYLKFQAGLRKCLLTWMCQNLPKKILKIAQIWNEGVKLSNIHCLQDLGVGI